MNHRLLLASLIVGAVWSGGVAFAQQSSPATCDNAPVLLAAADHLLAVPAKTTAFWRDNEGAAAAYLKIRHAPMDDAAARGFIDTLAARPKPPQRIEELALAQLDTAARRGKLEAAIKADGLGPALLDAGESGLRALLLDDDGKWLFALLAAAPSTTRPANQAKQLPSSVADAGDEALARLSAEAEKAKFRQLALGFSMWRSNLAGYMA